MGKPDHLFGLLKSTYCIQQPSTSGMDQRFPGEVSESMESIGMIRYAAQPLPFFRVKAANGMDLFHAPAIVNVNPKRPFTCNLTYCLDDWSCYT